MEARMLPPFYSYFFIHYNNYYYSSTHEKAYEILHALLSMGTTQ